MAGGRMTSGSDFDCPGCTTFGKLSFAGPSNSTAPFVAYHRYQTRSSPPFHGMLLVFVTVTVGQYESVGQVLLASAVVAEAGPSAPVESTGPDDRVRPPLE